MTDEQPDDQTRLSARKQPSIPDDATRVVARHRAEVPDDATRVVPRPAPDDATQVVHRDSTASTDSTAPAAPAPAATRAFVPDGVTESASDAYAIRSTPELPPVVRVPVTGPPVSRARPADPRAVEASVARSGTRRGLSAIALIIGSTVVVAIIVAGIAILVFGGVL